MSKPFTVIGYWDDSDTPVSVGVIEGDHLVHCGARATVGGDWVALVHAYTPEAAEGLAVEEMRTTLLDSSTTDDDTDTKKEGVQP